MQFLAPSQLFEVENELIPAVLVGLVIENYLELIDEEERGWEGEEVGGGRGVFGVGVRCGRGGFWVCWVFLGLFWGCGLSLVGFLVFRTVFS